MINNFTFSTIPKIVFGVGSIDKLPVHTKKYGKNVLLVTGGESLKKSGRLEQIKDRLLKEMDKVYVDSISNEPAPVDIDLITGLYHKKNIDVIVAIGGGSVLDAGKAISAMLPLNEPVKDYLEGVGTKKPPGKKVPFIAIPTTAGTGSETTKNAVISEIGVSGFKKSLRHENYVPDIALVDPGLTLNCPPEITAASGMDALTQLLESYTSEKCDEISASLALQALKAVKGSLIIAYKNSLDIAARTDLSYAAMISGITLANAGLGTVHGFASPLGGFFNVPHGVVCGTLMATTNKFTINKLIENGDMENIKRFKEVARIFVNVEINEEDILEAFVEFLYDLTSRLKIPKLGKYGLKESDFVKIIETTGNKNNPATLTRDNMYNILKERT